MADKKTNLRDAIMDLARGIESVFRRYTRSTRDKAWEKITSKDGEKEIRKILLDPNRQLSPFGKLANQRESIEEGMIRVWLDDERPAPVGFDVRITNSADAIEAIRSGRVSAMSLDHDLGEGGTGYDVAKFIEEKAFQGALMPMELYVHSANPVGTNNIRRCIDNAKRFWGAS